MGSRTQVLTLYKCLLREAEKLENYNFRFYAIRKIRETFRSNKNLNEQRQVKQQIDYAKVNLAILVRQAAIGNMYKTEKLVIENMR